MKLNFQLSRLRWSFGGQATVPLAPGLRRVGNFQLYRRCKGVTLIELGIVVAIIAILVAIGIVEYAKFDKLTKRNAALVATKGIADALRMYRADKKRYTTNINDLMPYINLTGLRNSAFDTTAGNPTGGVIIWTNNALTPQPYCIMGAPKGVNAPGAHCGTAGAYCVMHCVETNETIAETRLAAQPACRNGTNAWRACSLGM